MEMTHEDLALERVLERARRHDLNRPAEHTLIMGGSVENRRSVLDRIEAGLRDTTRGTPLRIGRPTTPSNTTGTSELWTSMANAAGLTKEQTGHENGLGRIQQAASEGLFVAIVDDLDKVLRNWTDTGEALRLRWAMQNINGVMIIATSKGPISTPERHEHAILAMSFATQIATPMAGVH